MYKALVVFSFILVLYSAVAFFLSTREKNPLDSPWIKTARWAFGISTLLITLTAVVLMYLIHTHQFQYNYVYGYSSLDLPNNYLLSTFWAGQEGSFLLWIFWVSVLGLFLIKTSKDYEPYVMSVFSISLVFLISMILGVKIGDMTIGSNPFKTIYEAFPGQVPLGFVPADGKGLNPLLQNYWMTIHPPILFTGFASSLVPFSFAMAALWRKKYDEWITPAMPWSIWASLSLGTGIMLGGYWAYETLGWGGYWAWDPVENSSLVPWLIVVASFHSMLVQRKTGGLKRFTLFLSLLVFISVVYSTFLTRSGVLADFSVHSFTGLGLYWQLLIFIIIFIFGSYGLLAYRWKNIPFSKEGSEIYSREFFMVVGSLVLTLLGIFVSVGTSFPVITNAFMGTPRTLDAAGFNTIAIPLAVIIALLIGMGQLLWYKKTDEKFLSHQLFLPFALSVLSTVILIGFGVREIRMLLLGFAGFAALYGNLIVLVRIFSGNIKLIGGALAHIGIAIMILGFISSGAYDTVGNFNLPKDEVVRIYDYDVKYVGKSERDGKEAFLLESPDKSMELRPIMYWSEFSKAWMRVPDIQVNLTHDFYVAPVMLQDAVTEKDLDNIPFEKGESRAIGDLTLTFEKFNILTMDSNKVSVAGQFKVRGKNGIETVTPIYGFDETKKITSISAKTSTGAEIKISSIDATAGKILVSLSGNMGDHLTNAKEILVVEASLKPYIGLVWLGTILMIVGFIVSLIRRWKIRKSGTLGHV